MADNLLLNNEKVVSTLLDYIDLLKIQASVCLNDSEAVSVDVDAVLEEDFFDSETPQVFKYGASQTRRKSALQKMSDASAALSAFIRSGKNLLPGGQEEAQRLQAEYIYWRDFAEKLAKQGLAAPSEESDQLEVATAQLAAAQLALNKFILSPENKQADGQETAAALLKDYQQLRELVDALEKDNATQ